jgi:predicted DCC family thiol-disulfide oxidoreductase YuxK
VLWDGRCGFCARCIAWAERRDRAGRLRFLPYQDAPTPPMSPRLHRACARAVHVVTPDGRVLRAGRAALDVLDQLGWHRTARLLAVPPLIWLVEVGYRVVADHRPFFSRLVSRR